MDEYQLDQAEKHVKSAWVVGLISASMTLVLSFIGAYSDEFRYEHGFDTWSLLDVALMAGLTYGIYKKSRFSALGLFSYYVLAKLMDTIASGQFAGGIMSLVFAYFLFQGVRGTYQIHKHLIETGDIVKEKRKHGLGYYLGVSVVAMLILGFTT